MGLLGPIIKGEVGDTIKVHFKNKASRPYTMHPHGVFYDKGSEGAFYDDHTQGELKGDDHVQPNMDRVYEWSIPENHAPTKDDENCLMWAYHSHVMPIEDINTGLIGKHREKITYQIKRGFDTLACICGHSFIFFFDILLIECVDSLNQTAKATRCVGKNGSELKAR